MGAQFKRVAINLLDFFCSCNPPECSQHSCKLNCGSFILPASFSVIGILLIIILVQIFSKETVPQLFFWKLSLKHRQEWPTKKNSQNLMSLLSSRCNLKKSLTQRRPQKANSVRISLHSLLHQRQAPAHHVQVDKGTKSTNQVPRKSHFLDVSRKFDHIIFSYFSASRTKRTQTLDRYSARLSSHYASSSLLYVRKCNGKYKTSQKWF